MTVEIIGDPAQLLSPTEFECVIADVPDYVPAVQRIKQAVKAKEALRVLVHDSACTVWLERFANSYGDDLVNYTIRTVRGLLAERWQTEIPPEVTDDAILASDFLKAEIVPRTGQSYAEIVLEHYWGEFFTFIQFPFKLAGDLIANLESSRWQANRELPLVMRVLESRQQAWLEQATRPNHQKLIRAVFETPEMLRIHMGRYKLLQSYPAQLGKAVLAEWYTLFKNLGLDPTLIDIDGLDLGNTIQEIEYYLNGLSSSIFSQADIENVLDQMSGFLVEEFEWVTMRLRDKQAVMQPNQQLLQRIASQFRPIQPQIETGLEALQLLIPPAYPPDPAKNDTVEDWFQWAVYHYMPYRFWLEENDRWDETVAGYAIRYADWFYENYTDHKYQYQERWVFSLLNQAGANLAQGRKILFIIVDNFNFKYLRTLKSHFNYRGFQVVEERPVWSLMPTATEISKLGLVAGETDLKKVQRYDYPDILKKNWKDHFAGYQMTYLPKLQHLQERNRFDEDLILLNYLPIDDVLHKDEGRIGSTHTVEIQNYIKTLVEAISQFAKRARVEQDLVIYVASDHGSTKIPPDLDNPIDDKFYRKQAEDRHHRYISVPKSKAAKPTAYDEAHCYIIRADVCGTKKDYFVPRGYGRFITTKESLYVHGGLTPEETIVPFCRLERAEIEAKQPDFRLPDNVIRYSVKANLVFVVGNPNDYEITNIELNIAESDLPGPFVEAIPAGISTEVTLPVRIKRQPGVSMLESITVEGKFELQGKRFAIQPIAIPVKVRSLMESKTDFDFGI